MTMTGVIVDRTNFVFVRTLAVLTGVFVFGTSFAELDDFFELDEETTNSLNAELGNHADAYWAHVDLGENESAPIITFRLITEAADVGSYIAVYEALRGKSEIEKLLYIEQMVLAQYGDSVLAYHATEVEFLEEISAIFFVGYYMDPELYVAEQYQLFQWSDDETKKCLLTSETDLKLGPYYSDSISGALAELAVICAVGLNAIDESQSDET